MSKVRVMGEFARFIRQERKYWLGPIVLLFVLFGLLLVFSASSPAAPLIYAIF